MNWNNLSKNLCPQCGEDLSSAFEPDTKMFICSCGFKITQKRFSEIVTDKVDQKLDRERDARNNGERYEEN